MHVGLKTDRRLSGAGGGWEGATSRTAAIGPYFFDSKRCPCTDRFHGAAAVVESPDLRVASSSRNVKTNFAPEKLGSMTLKNDQGKFSRVRGRVGGGSAHSDNVGGNQ